MGEVKKRLALIVSAFVVILLAYLLVFDRSSVRQVEITNLASDSLTILVHKTGAHDRTGNLYIDGRSLPECKPDDGNPCVARVRSDRFYDTYELTNLVPKTNYSFKWSDRIVGKAFPVGDRVDVATLDATINAPALYRAYGRVVDVEGNPVPEALVVIRSFSPDSLVEDDSAGEESQSNDREAAYGEMSAVTAENGTFYISVPIEGESNQLQNIEVYLEGQLKVKFVSASFNSKPYPDIVVGDEGSVLGSSQKRASTDLVTGLVSKAYAQEEDDTLEELLAQQERERYNIMCKPGENTGSLFPVPEEFVGKANENGYFWMEALITDLNAVHAYKSMVEYSYEYGVTPILRLCYQGSPCPEDGVEYAESIILAYAELLADGKLPSNGLYIHGGHNEPNVNEYRDPVEEAQFLADVINTLDAKGILSTIQNDAGVKVISPFLDLYHQNNGAGGVALLSDIIPGIIPGSPQDHPIYEAQPYLSAMLGNGALAAVKDKVYAWAVNAYIKDQHRGITAPADIAAFQSFIVSQGFSNRIVVEEAGRFINDTANPWASWSDLGGMLNQLMDMDGVVIVMLFNSLGVNQGPDYQYHAELWANNPQPGGLFGRCGGDGYRIFRQEGELDTTGIVVTGGSGSGAGTPGTPGGSGSGSGSGTGTGTGETPGGGSENPDDDPDDDDDDDPNPQVPPQGCYVNPSAANKYGEPIGLYPKDGDWGDGDVGAAAQYAPLNPRTRFEMRFSEGNFFSLASENFYMNTTEVFIKDSSAADPRLIFFDRNMNCALDSGEEVHQVGDLVEYTEGAAGVLLNLERGVNIFAFPYNVGSFKQSALLQHISSYDGYATSAGYYLDKNWLFVANRDGELFGIDNDRDITLLRNPISVIAHESQSIPFRTFPYNPADIKYVITPGWNLITVRAPGPISESVRGMNTQASDSGELVPSRAELNKASLWDNRMARYKSFAVDNPQDFNEDDIYGEDFQFNDGDAIFIFNRGNGNLIYSPFPSNS